MNTPTSQPPGLKWLIGTLTPPDKADLTIKFSDFNLGPTIINYPAVSQCRAALIKRMQAEKAEASFLVKSNPGTQGQYHAFDFAIPWIGVPEPLYKPTPDRLCFSIPSCCSPFETSNPEFIKLIETAALDGKAVFLIEQRDTFEVLHAALFTKTASSNDDGPVRRLPDRLHRVSRTVANEMFSHLQQRTCCIDADHQVGNGGENRHHAECIPFNYPKGGCEERAELSNLILSRDFAREKDALRFVNAGPSCFCCPTWHTLHMRWIHHRAPAVAVTSEEETLVLDPSLFCEPVSVPRWIARMASQLINIEPFGPIEGIDNPLEAAQIELRKFKNRFDIRICTHGWPPYGHCPQDQRGSPPPDSDKFS